MVNLIRMELTKLTSTNFWKKYIVQSVHYILRNMHISDLHFVVFYMVWYFLILYM